MQPHPSNDGKANVGSERVDRQKDDGNLPRMPQGVGLQQRRKNLDPTRRRKGNFFKNLVKFIGTATALLGVYQPNGQDTSDSDDETGGSGELHHDRRGGNRFPSHQRHQLILESVAHGSGLSGVAHGNTTNLSDSQTKVPKTGQFNVPLQSQRKAPATSKSRADSSLLRPRNKRENGDLTRIANVLQCEIDITADFWRREAESRRNISTPSIDVISKLHPDETQPTFFCG